MHQVPFTRRLLFELLACSASVMVLLCRIKLSLGLSIICIQILISWGIIEIHFGWHSTRNPRARRRLRRRTTGHIHLVRLEYMGV